MKFDCNPEDIVEEFEKEKAKLVNRNKESTQRRRRHHIRHEHHHKGHRNPPIQEVIPILIVGQSNRKHCRVV